MNKADLKELVFGPSQLEYLHFGTPEAVIRLEEDATHEGLMNLLYRGSVRTRLRLATTDEERLNLAERLVKLGDTEEQAMEKVIRSMVQQEAAS